MKNLDFLPKAGHTTSHFTETDFCVGTLPGASSREVTITDMFDIIHGTSIPCNVSAPRDPRVSAAR